MALSYDGSQRGYTARDAAYQIGHAAIKAYTRWVLKMNVEWQAALPNGPFILAANHPTTTDPFYILALSGEPMSILITEMAFKLPIAGAYLKQAGHIRVERERGREAFDAALTTLASGGSIAIFPEGSLSPAAGGLCEPRTGAARLALLSGAPVVPVGIHLDRSRIHSVDTTVKDMSDTARWYPSGPYAMTVGQPMWLSGDADDRECVRAASGYIMTSIARLARDSAARLGRKQAGGQAQANPMLASGVWKIAD